jgi:hypothetical protein
VERGPSDPGWYNTPDLTGNENPGSTGNLAGPDLAGHETTGPRAASTRRPPSPNGSRRAGDGRVSVQAWPGGHGTVTKRRERRLLRGVRSGVVLTVIALALGVATAASLGVIVWLIAAAIHHAASN